MNQVSVRAPGPEEEENGDLRCRDTWEKQPSCFLYDSRPCLHLVPEFLNPRLWIQPFKVVKSQGGDSGGV